MTLVSCHRKPIHRETLRQCWRVFFPTRQTVANWTKWKTNYPLQRNKTLPVTVGSGRPTECQTRPALALMCCFGSFGGGVSFSACVLVAVCRSADAADRPTHRRPVKKKIRCFVSFKFWSNTHQSIVIEVLYIFSFDLDLMRRNALPQIYENWRARLPSSSFRLDFVADHSVEWDWTQKTEDRTFSELSIGIRTHHIGF